jgi:glycosyltransferase involved in cell wall biosynthesis
MFKNNELLQQPLVSVIIPTYNRADVVINAIDSALEQTYKNIEIIVIDDGSTDNTQEKLAYYKDKITYIKKSNTGKSHTRNTGLENSKGSIIATLDSDDVWHIDYLEKTVSFLLANDLDIVFATCVAHGFIYQKHVKNQYHLFDYEEVRGLVLNNCPAPTSGVVMQRIIIGNGWHNASMEYEDWHLQIACIIKNKNCRVGFVSEILWEKREDEEVKNKLKTTRQNQRRTQDTSILLNRLKEDLTKKEYNIVQKNYLKDTIRLLLVLIKNGEDKREIWQNACIVLSKPSLLISMLFNVLKNKIE